MIEIEEARGTITFDQLNELCRGNTLNRMTLRACLQHEASGFGPDWDCKTFPNSEPVCIEKPGQ
jgi:hypothetical protein